MLSKPEQPLPDEWVRVFDDMVLVQQRTETERDALRAELEVAEAKDQYMMARLTHYCDLSDALRAKYERTQEWLDRFQGELAAKQIELLEAQAENERLRAALDDEREALCMEVERLLALLVTRREELSAEKDYVGMYRAEHIELAKENERLKAERAEWTWRINDGARSAKQIVEWLRHHTAG